MRVMRQAGEADPSLRRVQRDAAIIAALGAALALVIQRGRPEGALGVLAGAGLIGVSYAAIKGGVTAVLRRAAAGSGSATDGRASKTRLAWTLARFVGRYLVVAAVAWAVLVPLRAHPLGLFAGVSVPVLAIAIEAVRLAKKPARPQGPRPS